MKRFIINVFCIVFYVFLLNNNCFAHDPILEVTQISGAGFDAPIYTGVRNEADFEVRNTTNHVIRNINFSLAGTIPPGMSIDWSANDTTCTKGGILAANNSCHLEIGFTPPEGLEEFSGVYVRVFSTKDDVRGTNSKTMSGTILPLPADIDVTHTETDLPYLHLAYKAVVVENISSTQMLTATVGSGIDASINGLINKATVCWSGTSGCEVYSDPNSYVNVNLTPDTPLCQKGQILAPGENCHFWVRALIDEPNGLGSSSGSIDVTYDGKPEGSFNIAYSQNLYAGGTFLSTGASTTVNNIAKWDASNTTWVPLSSGITGSTQKVDALEMFNGDLYAGGYFTTAGGHTPTNSIAMWSGSDWSSLPAGNAANNGVLKNSTLSLVKSFVTLNGSLYVGGWFTKVGGTAAKLVAKWSGAGWSALPGLYQNGNVHAITAFGNYIYAGGANILNSSGKNVARWDTSSNSPSWDAGSASFNGTVSTMTSLG